MEPFFVGLLFGVLFSALFYLLGVLNRGAARTPKQLAIYLALESLLVAVFLLGLHYYWRVLSGAWQSSHAWFHDYIRTPVEWFQFLLGLAAGVLLRLWAVRISSGYSLTSALPEGTVQPAGQGDFLKQERGWVFALLGLLLIAVVLPEIHGLFRSMKGVKLAVVELAFNERKETSRAIAHSFGHEQLAAPALKARTKAEMQAKIDRERRSYPEHPEFARADQEFAKLYDVALRPYLQCMTSLVDEGFEFETIRTWTRALAVKLHAVVLAKDKDHQKKIAAVVREARTLVERSDCKDKARVSESAPPSIGLELKRSPEFYSFLAYLYVFLDNRLAAVQILESRAREFRDHMEWHALLAPLYFDTDPTLELSADHAEQALRIADAKLGELTKAIDQLDISCQGGRTMPAEAQKLCQYQERYRVAKSALQNGAAYALAHLGGDEHLDRALDLARQAVHSASLARPDGERYLMNLDTFAFAVMAAEAARPDPDADTFACAEQVFRQLASERRAAMVHVMQAAGQPGFRTRYISVRFDYEIAANHLNTASSILASLRESGKDGRCTPARLQALRQGTY